MGGVRPRRALHGHGRCLLLPLTGPLGLVVLHPLRLLRAALHLAQRRRQEGRRRRRGGRHQGLNDPETTTPGESSRESERNRRPCRGRYLRSIRERERESEYTRESERV